MADEDLVRPEYIEYVIGATQKFWVAIRDENRQPVTASACSIRIIDIETGAFILPTETVRRSLGLLEVTLANTYMTVPGRYTLEWDYTYSDGTDTIIPTAYTNIVAKFADATYLMTLVPRLRLYGDDDPADETKRIKTDRQWKAYIVEGVRQKMSASYSITQVSGQDEISPEPTAGSDDEKLAVLWGAWFYYRFGYEAIASERTRMFSISYAEAYQQMQNRIEAIEEDIISLDPNQAMYFTSETSIEFYGKINERTGEAIATWNT